MRFNSWQSVVLLFALMFVSTLAAKEADFRWNGKLQTVTNAKGNTFEVRWIALIGATYHWQTRDGVKESGPAIGGGTRTETAVDSEGKTQTYVYTTLPEITKIDGPVLTSLPIREALVICPCTKERSIVPIAGTTDPKGVYHENKPPDEVAIRGDGGQGK